MKRYLVASVLAFAMIGCGGSSSGTVTNNSVAKASINGVAVDDLIVNGIVKAYPASNKNNVLATGRTDANNGSYKLDVTHDGVVVVEVTCDSTSLMKNPADGSTKPCISGLALHSATAVTKDSGAVQVNISPLSELVVRQMQENGTSAANLEKAQNSIGLMFGVDPIASDPVKDKKLSSIIGAIHTMAGSGETILDVIDDINDDFKDGEAGDDGNISAKLAEAMAKAEVSNNLTAKKGKYTPPENPASMSDIGESKAFFSSLRTQAMSVVDYKDSGTAGFLDTEAANLGTALEGISLNTSIASEYVAGTITEILTAIDNNKTTGSKTIEDNNVTIIKGTGNVWAYSIKDGDDEKYSGTVTMPSNMPVNFTTLTASFDGTVPKRKMNGTDDTGSQTFTTNMTLTKTTAGADFVLSDATLSSDGESLAISNAVISTGYAYDDMKTEDKLTTNFVKLNSITLNGAVSGYTLSGTVAIPTYVTNSSIASKGFEEKGTDQTKFYNSGIIPKVATFIGTITNTNTAASLVGTLSVDVLNAATINLLSAEPKNPQLNVAYNGKLKMPSRPEMVVNLGYTNPEQKNNFTFSYSYDATVVNGTGNFDKDVKNGTIVLTNHLGLESTIKVANGDVVYGDDSSVKKGGKLIGKLGQREGLPVIEYTDGTFESLP